MLMRWSFQEPMPFPDNFFDVIIMLNRSALKLS